MNKCSILVLLLVVASLTRTMQYEKYKYGKDANDACITHALVTLLAEMKQKLSDEDEALLVLLDDGNPQYVSKRAQDQPFFWNTVSERVVWSLDHQENDLKERFHPPAIFKKKPADGIPLRSGWKPISCWIKHHKPPERLVLAVHTRDERQHVLMRHVLCKGKSTSA